VDSFQIYTDYFTELRGIGREPTLSVLAALGEALITGAVMIVNWLPDTALPPDSLIPELPPPSPSTAFDPCGLRLPFVSFP